MAHTCGTDFHHGLLGVPPQGELVYFADTGGPVPGFTPAPPASDGSIQWANIQGVIPATNPSTVYSMWGADGSPTGLVGEAQGQYVASMTSALNTLWGNFDKTNMLASVAQLELVKQELDYMSAHGGKLSNTA
jgi:hypothetical protein